MMNVLFMGTPDFAVPCLEALVQEGYAVKAVVTQPDKPKGRGHKMMAPPVKICAEKYGIEVLQPQSLREQALMPALLRFQPDVIVVVAYGKLLPKYILDFPRLGCINVHASLLPKYRGAGPIQWSIINGETQTGVTTMYMGEGLDTGDMIFKAETKIAPEETAGMLFERLSVMGASLLVETLKALENGTAPRVAQEDSVASYAPMVTKETGHIDWTHTADEILNLIRGTDPWPGCYTMLGNTVMKIIRASKTAQTGQPGQVLFADKRGLCVACGGGEAVVIDELQMQGGKRMSAVSYLNGHEIPCGIFLG